MISFKAFAGLLLLAPVVPARDYGPAVGSTMPDFELKDQNGKAWNLKSILASNGAVILFFRSADWCPYCKTQLLQLDHNRKAFHKLGIGTAAVSYDTAAVLHEFAQRRQLHLPLLSDPNSKLIRSVGMVDESIPRETVYFGSSYPCAFVLDSKGVIVAKYFENDHRTPSTPGDILLRHYGVLPKGRQARFENRQLKVTATASKQIVAPGDRVTLMLDVELKPGMHMYAHGVTRYQPLEWKMPDAAPVQAHEIYYPNPEELRLKNGGEIVPVYQGRFRLKAVVIFAPGEALRKVTDEFGSFTLQAALQYQVCDNRKCYVPQRASVKWAFQYRAFDQQRAPADMQRKTSKLEVPPGSFRQALMSHSPWLTE